MVSKLAWQHKGSVFESGSSHAKQSSVLRELCIIRYPQHVIILSGICLFRLLVEHPVALARADKN